MAKKAFKDATLADVSKAAGVDVDRLRLADYPQDRLNSIFKRATNSAKRDTFLGTPGMLAVIACIIPGTLMPNITPYELTLPVAFAGMSAYFLSRALDRRPGIRLQATHDALKNAAKTLPGNNPPAPAQP